MYRSKFIHCFGAALTFVLACSCQSAPGGVLVPPATGGLSSELQQELAATQDTLSLSVSNQLNQARSQFFPLMGRLSLLEPDTAAYSEMVEHVLPTLLGVANSLNHMTGAEVDTFKSEYRSLFSDSVAAMLGGVNTNLQFYQGFFEAPQSLGGVANTSVEEALQAVSDIFYTAKSTERYVAELAQFAGLIPSSETTPILNALQNQQAVLLSGVLNVSSQGASLGAIRQAYSTIATSLTQPQLFNQLLRLALLGFGDRVAYRQEQLTPTQTNPNALVMVVQEDDTTYRMFSFENNQLTNRIIQDTRGLTASDVLNQSTVVVIPSARP